MTPYGIVYNENIHAFEQSIKVWQKKFGVLTKGNIAKMFLIMVILIIVAAAALIITKADPFFVVSSFVFGMIMSVTSYFFVVKNSVIKQNVRANFFPDDTKRQLVVYEDRLEYTTAYGKGNYYYEDILFAHEKNGILTVIFDSAALPISVYRFGIEKGEYDKISFILRQKLGSKFEYEGGNF